MRRLILALGVPLFSLSANAYAHFNLTNPPTGTLDGKGAAPCGPDAPAAMPMPVTGGSMLKIDVNETTPHAGFYRVALSLQSRTALPADNVVRDGAGKVMTPTTAGNSVTADFESPAVFPVLADHLWPHGDGPAQSFHTELVVPNVTCEKCTLQVIEFMAGHPSNGPSAGFFYHHCADLKITANPALPPFNAGGAGGAGGAAGGTAGGAAGSGGTSTGGAGGAPNAGSGGASAASGAPGAGGGAGGAGAVGAAGANAAGASAAGAPGLPNASNNGDDGGCSLSGRAASSVPLLSVLVGLLALGHRRRRLRRAA